MARARTAGWLLVQLREFASMSVDRIRRHRPTRFAGELVSFVCGIKQFSVRMNVQEGWIGRFQHQAERGQGAGTRLQTTGIDPFALFPGVGSHINEILLRDCPSRKTASGGAEKSEQEENGDARNEKTGLMHAKIKPRLGVNGKNDGNTPQEYFVYV